jgi:hypothetical protein
VLYRPVKSSVVCPGSGTVGIAGIGDMCDSLDDLNALDTVLQFYISGYRHVVCLYHYTKSQYKGL